MASGGDPPAAPGNWCAALRGSLALRPGPWGVRPGLRAAIAAGLVLGGSVMVADLRIGGVAYLGVACAVSFIGFADYRSRTAMLAGQAVGAAVGMTVGALVPDTPTAVIAAAMVVGVLAGMIGRIGPACTGGAVMAVIGVAYTQFGRLAMPWWEPVLAYAIGSALLLALGLAGALFHRERYRRAAVSAVFVAAADLLDAPADAAAEARRRLAAASATARTAVAGYRIRPVSGPLAAAWEEARDVAACAAQALVDPPPPEGRSREWRSRAEQLRTGRLDRYRSVTTVPYVPGPVARLWAVIRTTVEPESLWTGARIGLCVGLATALAVLLHPPQHAFWIPLTVAVVLRPEYGAVLTRSLHRLAGTVVGVVVVAVLLSVTSSPAWLCAAAALALGLAAFTAPRLYGLAVVGITGSALLSIAVGDPLAVEPWARLLDTVLGCAVALVAGVVLWPRRGLPDQPRTFEKALTALGHQIDLELRPAAAEPDRSAASDEAYRVAHAWRAQLERDVAEPDPAHAAAAWLPVAMQLESTVYAVCAAGTRAREAPREPADVRAELLDLLRERRGTTPAGAADLLALVTGPLRVT
ncbi:MAG: FUSC family protein [Pseudonocardia sp.]|nr:FUSC family protein [Pseudonocardia sp.]